MNKSINLLVPETNNTALNRRVSLLRYISLGVLALIVVASVSLFFFIVVSPLPMLRLEETAAADKLTALRTKSGKLFLVRERLGKITTIIEKRSSFDELLARIQTQLPSDMTVERLQTNEKSFSITVSATSLLTVQTFITAMNSLKTQEKAFANLSLSELSYDQENPKYVLTISSSL